MPKIVDHEARREALLEAAEAHFAAYGYAAVRMRGLAQALGVSTGTLYHYFPSKRALFDALVHRVADRDLSALLDALGLVPGGPVARLDALFAALPSFEGAWQDQLIVLAEYARSHREDPERSSATLLREVYLRYERTLAEALGVDRSTAAAIDMALSGLMMQRLMDGGATPIGPVHAALTRLIEASRLEEGP